MSHLESVVRHSLKVHKEFLFLGDDGFVVQANDLDNVIAILVTDPKGNPTFDHYGDFTLLLHHLKAHGGHLHH